MAKWSHRPSFESSVTLERCWSRTFMNAVHKGHIWDGSFRGSSLDVRYVPNVWCIHPCLINPAASVLFDLMRHSHGPGFSFYGYYLLHSASTFKTLALSIPKFCAFLFQALLTREDALFCVVLISTFVFCQVLHYHLRCRTWFLLRCRVLSNPLADSTIPLSTPPHRRGLLLSFSLVSP